MRQYIETVNDIISKTRKTKDFPDYFRDENCHITDKLKIANTSNIFFSQILVNMVKNSKQ